MSASRGEDLTLALRMADAADAITLARYQAQDLAITTKPDNTPVTDADKSAEDAIRALLRAHRPDPCAVASGSSTHPRGIRGISGDLPATLIQNCSPAISRAESQNIPLHTPYPPGG